MYRRDPKKFRDRFNRWKKGKPVYQAGRPLPIYEDLGDFRKSLPTYNMGSGLVPMPMINATELNSKTVHDILSWLPWTGTAMDVRDAVKGDKDAIIPAVLGAVADTVGFRMLRKGYQATKTFKNAVKNRVNTTDAYRLMQDANRKTKRALGGAATYLVDWYSNGLLMLNDK